MGASVSRGRGRIQSYLADLILAAPEPMTFAEILAVAYPEGSHEFDIAKVVGGSNIGRVRSLRRALQRLCQDGTIVVTGERWRTPLTNLSPIKKP
jgi:hypothetical protein